LDLECCGDIWPPPIDFDGELIGREEGTTEVVVPFCHVSKNIQNALLDV